MSQKTSIHLELSDLSAENLTKVVELISDLGDCVLTYSIDTRDKKVLRTQPAYRKFDRGERPYSVETDTHENDIQVTDQEAVPLDIEPTERDINLVVSSPSSDDDIKSNIQKFL